MFSNAASFRVLVPTTHVTVKESGHKSQGACTPDVLPTERQDQERSEPPLKNGKSQTVAFMLTRSWRMVKLVPMTV